MPHSPLLPDVAPPHAELLMKLDSNIQAKFESLVTRGTQVLQSSQRGSDFGFNYVNEAGAEEWFVSTASFISRVMGKDSEHYVTLSSHKSTLSETPSFSKALAVLRAARNDYDQGYLFNTRRAVEAEIFDEFLEQAEYQLSEGYFQVACVIAGGVLEDGLRKLCLRKQIPQPDNPKLDSMNSELAKTGTYNKLMQKKITWLADIRNRAAHGQWDKFDKKDAAEMVHAVRRFMEDYFSEV